MLEIEWVLVPILVCYAAVLLGWATEANSCTSVNVVPDQNGQGPFIVGR